MDEVRHALDEVLPVGGECLAHHFRIEHRHVGGRQRARDLAEVEFRLLPREIVEAIGVPKDALGPMRGDEIGLLPEIEERVGRPLGVLEPVVARLGLDHRLHVVAKHAAHGAAPDLHIGVQKMAVGFGELCRVAHPRAGNIGNGLGRFRSLAGRGIGTHARVGAPEVLAHDFAALLEEAQHVAREFFRVVDPVGRRGIWKLHGHLVHRVIPSRSEVLHMGRPSGDPACC